MLFLSMYVQKLVNLPLPAYLKKFVQYGTKEGYLPLDYEYTDQFYLNKPIKVLRITTVVQFVSTRPNDASHWYATLPPETQYIHLEMVDPSLKKLHAIYLDIKKRFEEKMLDHMYIYKETQQNARLGLKVFLGNMDIAEHEYKIDRGYKVWQRYNKKIHKKYEDAA